jgi:hypothetical protein
VACAAARDEVRPDRAGSELGEAMAGTQLSTWTSPPRLAHATQGLQRFQGDPPDRLKLVQQNTIGNLIVHLSIEFIIKMYPTQSVCRMLNNVPYRHIAARCFHHAVTNELAEL